VEVKSQRDISLLDFRGQNDVESEGKRSGDTSNQHTRCRREDRIESFLSMEKRRTRK
jgi:hypothetical protein